MANSYRMKENIVHLSVCAGTLLTKRAIEVNSNDLTDAVIELAEEFETAIVPSLGDGEYLEVIELFGNEKLMKMFHCVDILEIGGIHHVNTNTATFHFFVNPEICEFNQSEEGVPTQLDWNIAEFIERAVVEQGYDRLFQSLSYEDSVITVNVKKEQVLTKLNEKPMYLQGRVVAINPAQGLAYVEKFKDENEAWRKNPVYAMRFTEKSEPSGLSYNDVVQTSSVFQDDEGNLFVRFIEKITK